MPPHCHHRCSPISTNFTHKLLFEPSINSIFVELSKSHSFAMFHYNQSKKNHSISWLLIIKTKRYIIKWDNFQPQLSSATYYAYQKHLSLYMKSTTHSMESWTLTISSFKKHKNNIQNRQLNSYHQESELLGK